MRYFLISLIATAAASAQPIPLDSLAQSALEDGALPSLVVGIVVEGERFVVGVGGAKDGAAPDEDTIYEIGSISKVLTSLALAEAVTRGDLDLEDPVAVLLPKTRRVGAHPDGPVRLVDLATHTSGLPRMAANAFARADVMNPFSLYDAGLLYDFLEDARPATPPGQRYEYSNAGAGLLGFALARDAGRSYADVVRDRVLDPLGLEDTFVDVPRALEDRFVEGYDAQDRTTPRWTFLEPTVGAGGWRSTAADLLTLAQAALDPDATPLADAIRLSLEPRVEVGDGRTVGLGWHLVPVGSSSMAVHDGGTGGFASFLGVLPDQGAAVVILTTKRADVIELG
ncbi:serine hydrolase domain-containing protein, partial [Rubrivirga sp.]|uniref:serine hydrolase domain-containing protein n=1 Tax=Rubrivirga sp. TaxID=1885344 RepID=UPI003C738D68